jgi:GT2 family glycosyltransferase
MRLTTVIIVNWNGRHLLAECLDSLRAQTREADEMLVVDNGSRDGSHAMIRERIASAATHATEALCHTTWRAP